MITFGRKLKHLRQKNHLTQKELGIDLAFRKILLMSELHNMKQIQESLVMKSLLKWLKYFTYQSMSSPFQYYLNQENMMLRPSGCMNFLQNYNFFNKIKKAGNL